MFLVSNEARDFHLLTPFIYYLERYENFEVTLTLFGMPQIIRKKRPDMVILPNCRGHKLYYEIAKYAFENNILVFHNDSEGNFNTEIDYDYWGFNRSKKIYSPIHFAWNEKVKSYLIKKYNFSPSEIKISGAQGLININILKKLIEKIYLKNTARITLKK